MSDLWPASRIVDPIRIALQALPPAACLTGQNLETPLSQPPIMQVITLLGLVGAASAQMPGANGGGIYNPNSACSPGTFAMGGNCIDCPMGTYTAVAGSSSCMPCAAGMSTSSVGSVFCTMCPAGTYSDMAGAYDCTVCPVQYYNDMTGSTACMACPSGTTTTITGATACEPEAPIEEPADVSTGCLDVRDPIPG